MRMAVLIGNPVAHSRSPAMFNRAFAAAGVDAVYVPWQLERADLEAALHTLRAVNALGANVTVPHKQAVLPYLDAVTSLARKVGAVNCIVQKNGKLTGDNTDVYGFAESLRPLRIRTKRALILGAGGAARAVIAALRGYEIVVCNRDAKRRRALQNDFPGVVTFAWKHLPQLLPHASLVVHATSAQVRGETLTLPFDAMPAGAVFADLTYGQPPLVRQAQAAGVKAFDGGEMLLLQAARAFQLWTRTAAPVAQMRKALRHGV